MKKATGLGRAARVAAEGNGHRDQADDAAVGIVVAEVQADAVHAFRHVAGRPLAAIAMVVTSTLYAIAQQPPGPTRVRGTIGWSGLSFTERCPTSS